MCSAQEYSRIVSRSLDCLGYSTDMVKHRVHMYAEVNRLQSTRMQHKHFYTTVVGSKGEGLSTPLDSDIDIMYVPRDIICAENMEQFTNMDNLTLFQTDTRETSPGYTQLKLVKLEGNCFRKELNDSLLEIETADTYLSSDMFVRQINAQLHFTYITNPMLQEICGMQQTSGPHIKYDLPACADSVASFQCFCPDLLQEWITRPRYHGWPTPGILRQISSLEAHVVPVGDRLSENQYKEWRISFTKAEMRLIHGMNETQTKLYVLLKMVAKSILRPVFRDVTSYLMKNIVLWLCERNGQELFVEPLLAELLIQSLHFLKQCVSMRFLPQYMIPRRNLLTGRLAFYQRKQLLYLLSNMLQEGGALLLRSMKLRDAMMMMCMTPVQAHDMSQKRDRIEKLELLVQIIMIEHLRPDMTHEDLMHFLNTNEVFNEIVNQQLRILIPDWIELLQQGLDINSIFQRRKTIFLS